MLQVLQKLICAILCLCCLSPIFILATDSIDNRESYDLIIRNGKVIDGTGNGWFYADVGIKSGKISAIGDLSDKSAREEINASGLIVAPGFIDPHTHADSTLLNLPYAENFIRDGVTTIITGNCGSSVRNIAGFFDDLMTTGVAVNVATLIGHNTILRQVKGDTATSLTLEHFEQCKNLLRQAMQDGALGMSTGLIYSPGRYSSTQEIIELQKVVAELGGIYATHMRSEAGQILEAIDEALLIGKEAGCRIQISHLKLPADNKIGGSQTLLNKILKARKEGQEVWIDQYPYTASSTGISTLLPDWLFEEGSTRAKQILEDPEQVKKVMAAMKIDHEVKRERKDFSFAVISFCRAYPEFVGKNLKEVAQIQKLRRQEANKQKTVPTNQTEGKEIQPEQLPEVTMEEQYRTIIDIYLKGGASCVFHTQAEEDVINIMRCPLVAFCSDSGLLRYGQGKPHPRGYGANARVLGRYVREKQILTLEEAVRKMTSLPALAFRLKERGLLREGYWADISIFNPEIVIDKATFEEPHQYTEGIEFVIVNGEIVLAKGKLTGKLPGRPIFGPAYKPPTQK